MKNSGGGVEIRMDQRWSLKGEYLFYNLGDEHLTAPIFAEGVAVGVDVPSSFGSTAMWHGLV